jgi:serine/threonine protein kinase
LQALLKELNHPNIVNFLGLCAEGDDDPDDIPDDSGGGGNVYLLLEYMALGDLRDYLYAMLPTPPTPQRHGQDAEFGLASH